MLVNIYGKNPDMNEFFKVPKKFFKQNNGFESFLHCLTEIP